MKCNYYKYQKPVLRQKSFSLKLASFPSKDNKFK